MLVYELDERARWRPTGRCREIGQSRAAAVSLEFESDEMLVYGLDGERRIQCVVPFCRHTRGQRKHELPLTPDTEWLCQIHWRRVPKRLKLSLRRAKRDLRRIADGKLVTPTSRVDATRERWQACKAAAARDLFI